jgi:molybdopterin-synthase adenylyltransferase
MLPPPSPPKDRYSRQERFTPLGLEGQRQLAQASVVIVGCGALGTYHAAALARAGVGHLRIIDRDYVEWNNLQRQWLYDEADAEQALPKAIAAMRALQRVNSSIQVEAKVADLTPRNIEDLLEDADLILDGTDNFETRYLVNDYAIKHRIPWIYGAAVGSYGLCMPVLPGETACLRCVYPDPPTGDQATCETAGVLATITTLIGSLQVTAALQILSGHADQVPRKLTTVDIWTGALRSIAQPDRDDQCPCCAQRQFPWLEGGHRAPISLCGRNAVQIHLQHRPIDLAALALKLGALGTVRYNEFALRFFVDTYELTIFADGRAIIKGTTEPGVARSLYSKYVGG